MAAAVAPRLQQDSTAQRRADLRLVAPVRHTGRYVIVLLLVAALGVFGVVTLGALAAEAAFTVRSLEGDIRQLSLRGEELTAEVAALEAPERITQIAAEELGMVSAVNPRFLPLAHDGATQTGSPAGALSGR